MKRVRLEVRTFKDSEIMESARLKLINCDEALLQLILQGDQQLAEALHLEIPSQWSEFGEAAFAYSLERIREKPDSKKWWTYLPVQKEGNILLGTCGYKGIPNEEGMVEIGYEVAEAFRNRGYATELAALLVRGAFEDPQVKRVQAHTLGEKNASVRVLEKCGFDFVEALEDEEEGTVWKWQLKR